ncbi:MAG TPA: YdeI/OmpD-associated family protein [Candidatus Kryptonia bacterium]
MGKKDPRVDAYIAKSEKFAQPILIHLRKIVDRACPDVVETIKWNMPIFEYKGILCNMASFKNHCAFGFWKGKLIFGNKRAKEETQAMGSFGKIGSVQDLPSEKIIASYIKKAMELNEVGIKTPARRKAGLEVESIPPAYFMDALKKNKMALETYEKFSPGNKREYVMWILEAKTDETRNKRLKTAIEWMAEGKIRNWKYVKK